MNLLYAQLMYNKEWVLSLIKRHYPTSVEFVHAYEERWERWYIGQNKTLLREFATNQTIPWSKEDIERYKYDFDWKEVAQHNKPLIEKCAAWGIEFPSEEPPKGPSFEDIMMSGRRRPKNDDDQEEDRSQYKGWIAHSKPIDRWYDNLHISNWLDIIIHEDFFKMKCTGHIWEYVKAAITPNFVKFLYELEFEEVSPVLEQELQYQNDHDYYSYLDFEKTLKQDPTDYTINDTDFPNEAINDAFEGDQNNVWNVD